MRPFQQTCSRLGRRSASCSGTVSSRPVRWPSLRLLLVTLVLFAGCSPENDQQAGPRSDENEATSESQPAGEPQSAEQVAEQPDAEPVPPTAAEVAQQKIEELGGLVFPKVGEVNLRGWQGSPEDLLLLFELDNVLHLTLQGPVHQDESVRIVSKLASLEVLQLQSTEVTDEGLAHLAHHVGIERLRLELSPITDAGLAHVATIPNLKRLYLRGVMIHGSGLGELARLERLETLSMYAPSLNEKELRRCPELPSLRALSLSGFSDDGTTAAMIRLSPDVVSLAIAPNSLSHLALEGIDSLENLERLTLIGNWVDDKVISHLGPLRQLKWLTLADVEVTDEGLAPLSRLVGLEHLNLGRREDRTLTDACVEHFRGLNSLQKLHVAGNFGISEAALQSLQEDIPDLWVMSPNGGISLGKDKPFRRMEY